MKNASLGTDTSKVALLSVLWRTRASSGTTRRSMKSRCSALISEGLEKTERVSWNAVYRDR